MLIARGRDATEQHLSGLVCRQPAAAQVIARGGADAGWFVAQSTRRDECGDIGRP